MPSSKMVFRSKSVALILLAIVLVAVIGSTSKVAAQSTQIMAAAAATPESMALCTPRLVDSSSGDRSIVSAEELNLRSGPSTECSIVAELKRGDALVSLGDPVADGDYVWMPVSSAVGSGYVIQQGIQAVPDGASCGGAAVSSGRVEDGVVAEDVNLRSGPGLGCPIIAQLAEGTPVSVRGMAIEQDGEIWLPVSTPLGDGYIVRESYAPPGSWAAPAAVAVLMYHDLGENFNRFVVAPWQLEQQLIWLRDNGYTSITPRDLVAFLDNGTPLPPRPVILSVDDGWPSTRVFRDLLAAYGFRGTYMLPNYAELSPEEIYDLNQNGEVCGHSVSHPFLDQFDYGSQYYEIVENKAWLENITGQPATCFAYPFGAFSDVTTQIVIDAGYRIAFHAWDGIQYFDGIDRWHITRIEVSGDWDLATFAAVVTF